MAPKLDQIVYQKWSQLGGVDLGSKLEAKLEPSWHQKRRKREYENYVKKRCPKKVVKGAISKKVVGGNQKVVGGNQWGGADPQSQ